MSGDTKNDDLRIKLCLAIGWTRSTHPRDDVFPWVPPSKLGRQANLPPLDAGLIREAMLSLLNTRDRQNAYLRNIQIEVAKEKDQGHWFWHCISAAPKKQARAILEAIGQTIE